MTEVEIETTVDTEELFQAVSDWIDSHGYRGSKPKLFAELLSATDPTLQQSMVSFFLSVLTEYAHQMSGRPADARNRDAITLAHTVRRLVEDEIPLRLVL